MQADEGDVEAADEEADGEEPEAAAAEGLVERLAARLRRRGPRSRRRAAAVLAQAERQRDHDDRAERQHQHGQVPVAEPLLQERGDRHHRELSERAPGGRDAERDRALFRRRLARDRAEDRPKARRRHADAGERVAERQEDAFGRSRDHQHAGDVDGAAGSDGARRAEAVGDVADEGRQHAHQEHRQRVAERPQLAPDLEVERDRLLEDAEALPRPDADRQDHGAADHRHPEAARRSGVG